MEKILQIGIIAVLAWTLSACGGSHSHDHSGAKTEQNATDATDKSGPEYTSAYICPMHCPGSGSDKPGACPVCGMDYVANEDLKEDAHDHDHDHDDPNHKH